MAEAEPTHADDTGGRRDRSRSRERNDAGAPVEGVGASNGGGRADDPAGYSHAPPPQYGGGGGQQGGYGSFAPQGGGGGYGGGYGGAPGGYGAPPPQGGGGAGYGGESYGASKQDRSQARVFSLIRERDRCRHVAGANAARGRPPAPAAAAVAVSGLGRGARHVFCFVGLLGALMLSGRWVGPPHGMASSLTTMPLQPACP